MYSLPGNAETLTFVVQPLLAGSSLEALQGQGQAPTKTSAASASVLVQTVPNPLPSPVFQTNLYTTSRGALMTHLVPGSTVSLSYGGVVIGQARCDNDSVVVPFSSPRADLPAGAAVTAQAQCAGLSSATVSSQVLAVPPMVAPRMSRPPVLGEALTCAKAISVRDSFPGATVTLSRDGKLFDYLVPSETSNLVVEKLQTGDVITATQRFDVREWNSSEKVTRTAESKTPPAPIVTGEICPLRDSDILVDGVSGALVHLRVVGSSQHILTGVIDPASGQCRFRVPASLVPKGVKELEVIQELCSLESAATRATVLSAPSKAPGQPQFATSLFGCGRVIALTGLVENTWVTVVSDKVGPIGSKLVTKPEEEISVSPLLIAGDAVRVVGQACTGPFGGSNKVIVLPRPSPQLKLSQEVLWVGDDEVGVAGVTPGSRVDLFIDGVLSGSVDVATEQHSSPVPALLAAQNVTVQQHECRGPSDQVVRSGPVRAKMQLTMTVGTVAPDNRHYATVGVPTTVLATVTDTSQQPISIPVEIAALGKTVPSNTPTPLLFKYDGLVVFATVGAPGTLPASASLKVEPLLKIGCGQRPTMLPDHSNLVAVVSHSIKCTFSDDGVAHSLPVGLTGPLAGVHRRLIGKGQSVDLTLSGSLSYTVGSSPDVLTTSGASTVIPLAEGNTLLTIWLNIAQNSVSGILA